MAWHIIPIGDLKEHIEDTTCPCHPDVIFENEEMFIVHNAFDGREKVERLLEISKN
jgi:hypothetical protein